MAYIIVMFTMIPLAYIWQLHEESFLTPKIKTVINHYEISLSNNAWAAITFAPLYLIYAFQYSVHSDYDNYEKMFIQIKAGTGFIREIAVYYINKVVAEARLDFQFVYIIMYLIAFFILAKCIRDYSKDFAMSLILFVTVFFVLGFLQLRQLVAVIISFYSYRYITEGRLGHFIINIAIACLFHISAIIMFPAYFIMRYEFKCSYYVMVSGLFGILTLGQEKILTWLVKTFLPNYYGRHEMFRNLKIGKWDSIFLLVILFTIIVYYRTVRTKNPVNRQFINGFFIYFILFFLGRWIIEFDRFGYYFYFPSICLIPNLLDCEQNIYFKWFMKLGIMFLAVLFWMIRYSGGDLFHYTSIFSI